MMAGNTDIYEVIFKSTGIILGTLVAIYMLGKFLRVTLLTQVRDLEPGQRLCPYVKVSL